MLQGVDTVDYTMGMRTDACQKPASRLKAREAYENGRTITDQQKYAENVKLAGEVAAFLRKNIVQGAEVEENIYCEFSATFLALSISREASVYSSTHDKSYRTWY